MAPHSSSAAAGIRSIRRELQRRRAKQPLAPRPAAITMKPSAPPPRAGARDEVREPCPRPPRDQDPCSTTSEFRGSSGTHALPRSSSAGSACPSAPTAAVARLKPGAPVGVRTRSLMVDKVTGKTIVLWLSATVVSAADDGGYDVVYDGKLPHGDPYATVRVPRHHVRARPQKPSTTTPPPPSSAARSDASASIATLAAACKSSEMQPAPRPTTAGKSVRLIRKLFPEMERPARAILPGY